MNSTKLNRYEIEKVIKEIVEMQKKRLLSQGQRLVKGLTADDILQPNDFPQLENDPEFRYEEGILAGIQMVQMALQAAWQERGS